LTELVLYVALGIAMDILLLFAKDSNGKPDLTGNAQKQKKPTLMPAFVPMKNGKYLF
jgi:hypothetical protein